MSEINSFDFKQHQLGELNTVKRSPNNTNPSFNKTDKLVVGGEEQLFFKNLENQDNTQKHLPGSSIKNLEIIAPGSDLQESYEADQNLKNPLSSQVKDIGLSEYNAEINSGKSAGTIRSNLLSKLESSGQGDKAAIVKDFISKNPSLANDKEAMVYLSHLVLKRSVPLSNQDLGQLLNKLTTMGQHNYDQRIGSKRDLIVAALHDIASPSNIAQRKVGTCSATCIQISMAMAKPTEYLDMLDTLAQNKDYRTVSGKMIRANWTFTGEKARNLDSQRTISSKIMQNAIMDFADGLGSRRGHDRAYDSANKDKRNGLYTEEAEMAREAIFGKSMKTYGVGDYTSKDLINILKAEGASRQNPVQIAMNFTPSGQDVLHAVNVVNVDSTNNSVTIINPWGREETMSMQLFEKKLLRVIASDNLGDKLAPRMADADLNKTLAQPRPQPSQPKPISQVIHNDHKKSDNTLNKMTLEQKFNVIVNIASDTMNISDKHAAILIFDNILQGGLWQDTINLRDLQEIHLDKHNLKLDNLLLNTFKLDDNQDYLNVLKQVILAEPGSDITARIIEDKLLRAILFASYSDSEKDELAKKLRTEMEEKEQEKAKIAAALLNLIGN